MLVHYVERKLLRALGRFGSKEGKRYKIYFGISTKEKSMDENVLYSKIKIKSAIFDVPKSNA